MSSAVAGMKGKVKAKDSVSVDVEHTVEWKIAQPFDPSNDLICMPSGKNESAEITPPNADITPVVNCKTLSECDLKANKCLPAFNIIFESICSDFLAVFNRRKDEKLTKIFDLFFALFILGFSIYLNLWSIC